MTGEEIYTKLNEYLRDQPCPDWARAELQELWTLGSPTVRGLWN